jgi:hypothetical protein
MIGTTAGVAGCGACENGKDDLFARGGVANGLYVNLKESVM